LLFSFALAQTGGGTKNPPPVLSGGLLKKSLSVYLDFLANPPLEVTDWSRSEVSSHHAAIGMRSTKIRLAQVTNIGQQRTARPDFSNDKIPSLSIRRAKFS
jgi:hypothetical protein